MRTKFKIGLLLIIVSIFTYCEKEIQPEFIFDNNVITLFEKGLQVNSESHVIKIPFEVNKEWSAKIEFVNGKDWCSLNPLHGGLGKNEIIINIDENPDFSDRELKVILTSAGLIKTLKIKQFAKEYLTIQPTSKKIIGKGENFNISVESNSEYRIEIPDTFSWILYEKDKNSSNDSYVFSIGINPNQKNRMGFVLVKGINNELTDTMRIIQDSVPDYSIRGTANTYVVSQNKFGKIKISNKGNDINQKLAINENTQFQILWEDKNHNLIKDVTIIGEYLYFQTLNYEGSSLVAVKNNNEIIWSWHLWILNDADKVNNFQSITRLGFLNRNLGAIKTTDPGFHYQWGRKDPLLIGKYTVDSIAENLGETIKNPTVFNTREGYTDYSDSFSWYKGMTTSLWQTNNKTIYDPSPYGYIVPNRYSWDVPNGQNGWENYNFIFDQADAYYPDQSALGHSAGDVRGWWSGYWTSYAIYAYPNRWRSGFNLTPGKGVEYYGSACSFGMYVRPIRYDKEN